MRGGALGHEPRAGALWFFSRAWHGIQGPACVRFNTTAQTYRHALAATTVRPDTEGVNYLYTLNLSCRQDMWDDLQPLFKVRRWAVGGCLLAARLGDRRQLVQWRPPC